MRINKWAIFFLALTILAGIFAFGLVAGVAVAGMAYMIFFISLGLFVMFLLFSRRPKKTRNGQSTKTS